MNGSIYLKPYVDVIIEENKRLKAQIALMEQYYELSVPFEDELDYYVADKIKNFVSGLTKILKVDTASSHMQDTYTLNMVEYARLLRKYNQLINEDWLNSCSEKDREYILSDNVEAT